MIMENEITIQVTFNIKNLGFKTSGVFSQLTAKCNFDPNHLTVSRIELSISVVGINTGNKQRDKHLLTKDYFHSDKYPFINVESISFKKVNEKLYEGLFLIKIKDVSEEMNIPFTFDTGEGIETYKAEVSISRKLFGIGGFSLMLADKALVNVKYQKRFDNSLDRK
jgi:polyisoprenoid-binding protein YceI